MNAAGKCWDEDLLADLGLPGGMFQRIAMPGESLGKIRKELAEEFGFDLEVILPCTHDTASAILAIPADDEDYVFISSGTWSLLGIERDEPDCSEGSRQNHFTNEGGFDSRICYHRNIMGLWMIQSVRHELGDTFSLHRSVRKRRGRRTFLPV